MHMFIFMIVPLSFAQTLEDLGTDMQLSPENASANAPSLAQVNEGVACGLCVAAIFLCLFALEAMRGEYSLRLQVYNWRWMHPTD